MNKFQKDPNPNSPANFFSNWLFQCTAEFINSWHKDHLMLGTQMLQHVLEFSNRHNKSVEMFDWLNSSEGYQFLKNQFDGGKCLIAAIEDLNEVIDGNNPNSYVVKKEIISEYIRETNWPYEFQLNLVNY